MAVGETVPASPSQTGSILIVEDAFILALNLQENLTSWGYHVIGIAATSEEAWALASQHQPDVVLMDIQLQGETDGITTAARIRQAFDAAIIYITAHAMPELLKRAEATEPAAYLMKPVRLRELQANLQMVLYQRWSKTSTASASTSRSAGMAIPPPIFAGLSLLLLESNNPSCGLFTARSPS